MLATLCLGNRRCAARRFSATRRVLRVCKLWPSRGASPVWKRRVRSTTGGPPTWQACLERCDGDRNRNRAMMLGYREGVMTMTALASQASLSVSIVSRMVSAAEAM